MKSQHTEIGAVPFPEFRGDRVYMAPFYQAAGLPPELERWQPTVDAMLSGIKSDGPIYLMVDQGVVHGGATHRRPGMHVDGVWIPSLQCHGGGGGGGRHVHTPSGGHRQRPVVPNPLEPFHHHAPGTVPGRPPAHHHAAANDDILVLASSAIGCDVLVGDWDGVPGRGGDMSHLDLSGLERRTTRPGVAYAGSALEMIHASVPASTTVARTLVRLNISGAQL